MNDYGEKYQRIPEPNKVSGLSYVFTDTGLELPVLDITHPLFEASIDEKILTELCAKSPQAAAMMKMMPDAQKKMIADHSYIFGTHFYETPAAYLSGMGTYMLKLGPQLIGGGEERKIDRMATMGVSGIAARMRLRDLCRLQTEALSPQLRVRPGDRLCLINIAGGAASDSINTLRLIQEEDPSLLMDRRIEIHLFEIDALSSRFAEKSVKALKEPGCAFQKLDLTYQFHRTAWSETAELTNLLISRGNDIVVCSSEGGLFEYGQDEDIHAVLKTLNDHSSGSTIAVGSALLDRGRIDPTITAMAETSGAALRFLGKEGIQDILAPTGWAMDGLYQNNPVYLVFRLKKCRDWENRSSHSNE
ncbi:MAG: hypothetical protein L6425_15245 [Candidatus Aminicenantes bacterium]|nr:hypothetical protein [Candidatus Aminicenantes bacterium]